MATVYRRRLMLLVAVAVLWSATNGEIHRAKSLNVRPRPHQHDQYRYPAGSLWPRDYAGRLLSLRPSLSRGDENDTGATGGESWMTEVLWGHEAQTWVFSVVSACLVGLSGIFPLVVIPIEAGRSLRSGAANHRLKLLLSFAVGGLLGDVFLHLLPETWAHLQQFNGSHKGHSKIGLWIIAGLLSFFVIQKIFPESEEEEEEEGADEQEEENEAQQKKAKEKLELSKDVSESYDKPGTAAIGSEKANGTVSNGHKRGKKLAKKEKRKNGLSHAMTANGVAVSPDMKKVVLDRMCNNEPDGPSKEMPVEGWIDLLRNWVLGDCVQNPTQNSHIKTSGWLNLMANMIDNFTHGLAVAGSYSVSLKTGLLTTVAILLHEIPHEIGDFAILLKAGFDRWKAAKAQLVTATGGMLGALLALAAESTKEAGDSTAWILPFTAGGFIYIALVTVVPDLLKETNPWHSLKQLVFLCAGILTMAAVGALVD